MTTYHCRFVPLLLLAVPSCAAPDQEQHSEASPTVLVQANGRTFTVNELLREKQKNPNRFELFFRNFVVRAKIADLPLFDQRAYELGYGYAVPLKPANIEPDPEIERDYRNLGPLQLYAKYGDAAAAMISARVNEYGRADGGAMRNLADVVPFRASMTLADYSIEKAAALEKGQTIEAHCTDMDLSPVAVDFAGCTIGPTFSQRGSQ